MVNALLTDILDTLSRNYLLTIIDEDAGLEHLSRRTDRDVDVMLIVTDPSAMGFRTAARIKEVAREVHLEFKKIYLVGNRFSPEQVPLLEEKAREMGLEVLGTYPTTRTSSGSTSREGPSPSSPPTAPPSGPRRESCAGWGSSGMGDEASPPHPGRGEEREVGDREGAGGGGGEAPAPARAGEAGGPLRGEAGLLQEGAGAGAPRGEGGGGRLGGEGGGHRPAQLLPHVRSEYVAVVACDHPRASLRVMERLAGRARGRDGAVPLWPNGYLEPLHAVYRTEGLKRAVEEGVRRGERRLRKILEGLDLVYVPVEELRELDPGLDCFFNLNSPEDLRRLPPPRPGP